MSWREFSLRSIGYKRQTLEKWKHTREIAYYSLIGSHSNPKKLPKSIEQFMPMEGDRKIKSVTDEHRAAYLKAFQKYVNEQQQS